MTVENVKRWLRAEKWSLWVAYILLVAVVVWSARQTNNAVDDVQQEACIAAVVSLLDLDPGEISDILERAPENKRALAFIAVRAEQICYDVLDLDLEPDDSVDQFDGSLPE